MQLLLGTSKVVKYRNDIGGESHEPTGKDYEVIIKSYGYKNRNTIASNTESWCSLQLYALYYTLVKLGCYVE